MEEKHNTKCRFCGSNGFHETISREWCESCGIECNYHGNGMNSAYLKAMKEIHAIEHRREHDRQIEEECANDRRQWGIE